MTFRLQVFAYFMGVLSVLLLQQAQEDNWVNQLLLGVFCAWIFDVLARRAQK